MVPGDIMDAKSSWSAMWQQVKDENNEEFLTKLMLKIGVLVPSPATLETALGHIAKRHSLLGNSASTTAMEEGL